MFYTAEFWVLVAFVIFIGIVAYVGGLKKIMAGIDERGRRVRAELDEARRLREEAAAVLADYQQRQGEAEREAEAIVAAARQEAERIGHEAHARMADFVTRRTASAEAKIAQAETQAAMQVRNAAAEAAVKVSETILREQARGPLGSDLITRGLSEVRTGLGDVRSKLHA